MKQKILVAVTGMTPQIVTETVYALHKNHNWLPEKIIVLTTLIGKQQIVAQLFGENGYFQRLRDDFRLPEIEFNEQTIYVISENGQELDDIRSAEQNNVAADLIVRTIYDLCQDKHTELHISIAGGRKSMGFYVGYALSLFGRTQDKMSHVLVDENFEMERSFFYPTPNEQFINTKKGMLDASQAQVMLAEIPFVRMMQNQLQFAFDKEMTFSQAVKSTQQVLSGGAAVQFNSKTCTVKIGDMTQFELPPAQFCIYAAMAKRTLNGKITTFINETGTHDFIDDFLYFYQHHQEGLRGSSRAAQDERANKIADLKYIPKGKNRTEIKRIFDEASSNIIKKFLRPHLGEYGLRFAIESSGKNNAKVYSLNISPHLIEIIE